MSVHPPRKSFSQIDTIKETKAACTLRKDWRKDDLVTLSLVYFLIFCHNFKASVGISNMERDISEIFLYINSTART